MGVTNIWHVVNLTESPFFQAALSPDGGAYPLDLFVGRAREAEYILRGIGSSLGSRHAVQGAPGVGKTTLVQYVKEQAARDGYLVNAEPISVRSLPTADALLTEILASVYDALLARDATVARLPAMQDVRQLVTVYRTRSLGINASLPLLGGAGLSTATGAVTGPAALTTRPFRLLRDLGAVVTQRLEAPGIVIHLNNLENATEADRTQAARVVRDLRDQGLMLDGFHYLLVGTDDAIRTVVAGQEQLRSVFANPGPLQPLTADEVEEMLERRYAHLRHFPDRPTHRPVTPAAVRRVYALFEGNLRGTLHALDEAAKVLIGYGASPTDPMDLPAMRPVLRAIYRGKLDAELNAAQAEVLALAAERGPDVVFTQGELAQGMRRRVTTVGERLTELRRLGYVVEAEEVARYARGRPARGYRLSGAARLAFGALD